MFATVLYFFSTRNLRGPSADRCEILRHARKHVLFYNACPKIWRSAQKKFWGDEKHANFVSISDPLPILVLFESYSY